MNEPKDPPLDPPKTTTINIEMNATRNDETAGPEVEERSKKIQTKNTTKGGNDYVKDTCKSSTIHIEMEDNENNEKASPEREERINKIEAEDTEDVKNDSSLDISKTSAIDLVLKDKKNEKKDPEVEKRKEIEERLQYLMNPNITPSFMAIISPDHIYHRPKRIRIDVNAYLGLKKKRMSDDSRAPMIVPSARITIRIPANPRDEGYYEGARRLGLADDSQYLSELHTMIRDQLELFSATDDDIRSTHYHGRRTPTVRGKVGIRCVHCAKVNLSYPVERRTWPTASISFPPNIEGIYPVCTQKTKLHFESCPYMPQEVKSQIYRLCYDCNGNSIARQNLNNSSSSIGSTPYYKIAAKRIGLVNVDGGMRFGRDLKLEPLSVESIRAEVEASPKGVKTILPQGGVTAANASTERIVADDESARVLADAISEKDSDLILGHSDDSKIVTDFVFLVVRQMAICHADNSDFLSRGKKTAMMKVGFAGFCCRYCIYANTSLGLENACRSFTSAADNLTSAVTGSFYLHLQRCPFVPRQIRKAVAAYKRIHPRQMAQLPHGSQRRLFHALWARLRAADLSEKEMNGRPNKSPPVVMQPKLTPAFAPECKPNLTPDNMTSSKLPHEAEILESSNQRGNHFTVCSDEETRNLLKAAIEDTNYAANDNLIVSSDRHLVSDYIFFMMRNLKAAIPTARDLTRGRRTTVLNVKVAGVCCKHCHEQDASVSLNGRSFPSQPDNMASSFNTSLYQHMLRCAYVPDNTKRAIQNLKKIHSEQCSQLRFGSQRKFFKLVFDRLKAVDVPPVGADVDLDTEERLSQHDFFRISPDLVECTRCRRIPTSLRAPNAIVTGAIHNYEALSKHQYQCMGSKYCLHRVCDAMSRIMDSNPNVTLEQLCNEKFVELVKQLVGTSAPPNIQFFFTDGAIHMLRQMRGVAVPKDHHEDRKYLAEVHTFPDEVDFESVASIFQHWAKDIDGVDSSLRSNKVFLNYFQLISPSLFLPLETEKKESLT